MERETRPLHKQPICLACGAERHDDSNTCWMCGLVTAQLVDAPANSLLVASANTPQRVGPSPLTFSLATILMFMTLSAVVFGLARIEPGYGTALAIVALPAFVMTAVRSRHQQARGRRVGAVETVLTFLISSAVVVSVGLFLLAMLIIAILGICIVVALQSPGP